MVLSSSAMRMGGVGYTGSSTSLWNCATYGCDRASSAVMRFEGLNLRHRRSRSRASGEACGNMSDKKRGFEGGSDSSMLAAKGDLMDSMSSADGLPVTCHSNPHTPAPPESLLAPNHLHRPPLNTSRTSLEPSEQEREERASSAPRALLERTHNRSLGRPDKARGAVQDRGVQTSMIRSSWFMVDVPGNVGLPPSICSKRAFLCQT